MIHAIQIGLGPIGQQVIRYISAREQVKITAGVDIDPDKVGRTLGDVSGIDSLDAKIYESLPAALNNAKADVAILTTVSKMEDIEPQIEAIAKQKLNIISTCEELTYPWKTQPEIAQRIDKLCKRHGISCLATGVNPGFLMDYLPSVLSSVCQRVDHVHVARIQDASPRRKPFQKKIGVGLSGDEFEEKRTSISHVGLPESVHMIAAAMGWSLDKTDESLQPVLAGSDIAYNDQLLKSGQNRGVEQIAYGYVNGTEVIKLTFRAAVGEPEPRDTVQITGQPSFTSTIDGGINGDIATAAISINAIRSIQKMNAGLKTMLDIPAPAFIS